MSQEEAVQKMMTEDEEYRREWNESLTSAELKEILEKTKDSVVIKTVVCLGTGSFCEPEGCERVCTHLAALMTVIDYLKQFNDISYIAQDPSFTEPDDEFLEQLGSVVPDDPAAFRFINEETLVHAIAVHKSEAVLQQPSAAAIIAYNTSILVDYLKGALHRYEKFTLPIYADPRKGEPDEPDEPHDWVCYYVRNQDRACWSPRNYKSMFITKEYCY